MRAPTRFIALLANRAVSAIAAVVLTSTAAVLVASPASAAPDPVFIKNVLSGVQRCLDHHYSGTSPTTTAYAWPECHYAGNQQWWFEFVGGDNVYRVKNKRSNYTWCLSAPNGPNTRVDVEICVPGRNRQHWQAQAVGSANWLRNIFSNQCLSATTNNEVYVVPCAHVTNMAWTWSPTP